jgi:prevent-host-death family protein
VSGSTWSLQKAKNKFSELVALAERGSPQLVMKHGRAAVYVVDAREFESMRRHVRPGKTLGEHLLDFPTGGPEDFEFERSELMPRDVEF